MILKIFFNMKRYFATIETIKMAIKCFKRRIMIACVGCRKIDLFAFYFREIM